MSWPQFFFDAFNFLKGSISLIGAGALFAAGMALVTLYLKSRSDRANEQVKRDHDLTKWRAEFYLAPKLEALRTLHKSLVGSHFQINLQANLTPRAQADYSLNVETPKEEFFNALTTADIYLDEDSKKLMYAVLGSLRQMAFAIWLHLPDEELPQGIVKKSYGPNLTTPDWDLFTASFKAAHEELRELLNPEELFKAMKI
ncbi:MAG: hypothetical protein JWO80_4510 [Bryobacterales bacterium]|nr:hypothetical protein [Bryobacterales bacterium]